MVGRYGSRDVGSDVASAGFRRGVVHRGRRRIRERCVGGRKRCEGEEGGGSDVARSVTDVRPDPHGGLLGPVPVMRRERLQGSRRPPTADTGRPGWMRITAAVHATCPGSAPAAWQRSRL